MSHDSLEMVLQDTRLLKIRRWLHDVTGIWYKDDRMWILSERLKTICLQYQYTVDDIVSDLQQPIDSSLKSTVIDELCVNHTSFFRDIEVLDEIRSLVFPYFLEQKQQKRNIRIWSAATSSGEEALSLAMMIREELQTDQSFDILGTDISRKSIQQAKNGLYSKNQIASLPTWARKKYFHRVGLGQYQIHSDISNMCRFQRMNLFDANWSVFSDLSLTVCRNVLYYFSEEAQQKLIQRIWEHTAPQGFLVTSSTESLRNMDTRWKMVFPSIYRKE